MSIYLRFDHRHILTAMPVIVVQNTVI